MKKFLWFIIGGTVCVVVLILFFIMFFTTQTLSTTLSLTLKDAVSKSWVYNSTIRLQNRVIRGYKSTSFTFKNIKTGKHLLSVSAPNYESKEINVNIHSGKNVLKEPIELKGVKIPDIESISIFEKKKDDDIFIDIRLVGKDGHAITDHPCLPIRVIINISAQLVNGEYDRYREGDSLARGKQLYAGEAKWIWNTGLSATYKYSAFIPVGDILPTPAPYWIIAYLIILPNPLEMSEEEVEEIVQKVYSIDDPQKLTGYLSGLTDTLDYYFTIKPNVETLLGGAK